ncbi:MAG: type I-E CRISPR-associated protein Cse1/CasA [Peptoniphilaceae bacterium]|nr:type I-E CRISPR-associated protein Cse1/CasA [Peptoniphilaceae bacterium]
MGRFNLIDDKWIEVLVNKKGDKKFVGLRDIFENANTYLDISGDMNIQDFAIMRLILAIMHTVFSRFDASGDVYEEIEINDKMQQVEAVDDEDYEYYEEHLLDTWKDLWNNKNFPEIVLDYLDLWHDRFYLYDDKYPFFQVTEEYISVDRIKGKKVGDISGKTINRTITESNNKIALFSPREEKNKNILKNDEIARWLITFQAYTGLSDKTVYGKEKYKTRNSKGWLYDLGAVYFKGDNLFETLMLNFVIVNTKNKHYSYNIQNPSWEFRDSELIDSYLNYMPIDNIAQLYTVYSRAIYIDPKFDDSEEFTMNLIKLPEVSHEDNFLEPMTVYRYNTSGDYKEKYTPRKHPSNQSMWRSFGQITMEYENLENSKNNNRQKRPGIIDWLAVIHKEIDYDRITVNALSLEDDGNATSWVPTNEIYDSMPLAIDLLTEDIEDGWTQRIFKLIEETKKIINQVYGNYLRYISKIRGLEKSDFVDKEIEKIYFLIDKPFRDLIESIEADDDSDIIEDEWRKTLKNIVYNQGSKLFEEAGNRDYALVKIDGELINVVIAFNRFKAILNNLLERRDSEKRK